MKNVQQPIKIFSILTILLLSVYTPTIAKGRNNDDSIKTTYKIVFFSRGMSVYPFSATGHAFVSFVKEDENKKKCYEKTYGFFPSDNPEYLVSSHFSTEGDLKHGFETNNIQNKNTRSATLKVDSATWERAKRKVNKWKRNTDYTMLSNNCVAFMADVAKAAGLETPVNSIANLIPILPPVYLKWLKKRNKRLIGDKAED